MGDLFLDSTLNYSDPARTDKKYLREDNTWAEPDTIHNFYDSAGKWNKSTMSVTYGAVIDTTNKDPNTAVTYDENTSDAIAGWDYWKDKPIFRDIRPCLVKDGAVQYYIRRNDFTAKIPNKDKGYDSDDRQPGDGNAVLTGADGDVMIEFPRGGYRLHYEGDKLHVEITSEQNKPNFCYGSHSLYKEGDCSFIYVGAYLGSLSNNILRSVSGTTPAHTISLIDFRKYAIRTAQVEGKTVEYQLVSFYSYTLFQACFIILYKSLDSQSSVGLGYVTENTEPAKSGGTNKIAFCGNNGNDGKHQVKLMGVEDPWGNLYQWLGGMIFDSNRKVLQAYRNFNSTGSGYPVSENSGITSNITGTMKKAKGSNNCGFLPTAKATTDATNIWYCDNMGVYAGYFPCIGGCYTDKNNAGLFNFNIGFRDDYSNLQIGSRLQMKVPE